MHSDIEGMFVELWWLLHTRAGSAGNVVHRLASLRVVKRPLIHPLPAICNPRPTTAGVLLGVVIDGLALQVAGAHAGCWAPGKQQQAQRYSFHLPFSYLSHNVPVALHVKAPCQGTFKFSGTPHALAQGPHTASSTRGQPNQLYFLMLSCFRQLRGTQCRACTVTTAL